MEQKQGLIPIEIYTDGSSKNIKGTRFGGWAFIVVKDGQEILHVADGENLATNQKMELVAIMNALKYAASVRQPYEHVMIYSDSAYAINCYKNQWYLNWQSNGWRNAKNQDVANKEIWYEIVPFFENPWYAFYKVEGHNGVFWNEKCDKLAQREAERLKLKWRGFT